MCGIAGFFDRKKYDVVPIVQSMIKNQLHRGPDDTGHAIFVADDLTIALAHSRLAIIDVSALAHQPMHFQNLTLVYNGEVYNFREIKSALVNEGYDFTSEGDTEVVLKALHKWGIAAVQKFRGMFAFCLYDQETKKAYLVRDRAGVKPLYYYHTHEVFIFASEASTFQYHPQFNARLCPTGLNLFLQYGYISAPWTIYSKMQKVRPGHYVEYDLRSHVCTEKKYWDLSHYYCSPKFNIHEQEAVEELEHILHDAFTLRLVADVDIGILLSGGIDSSLIAAMLQTRGSARLKTFTMGFDQAAYDEAAYARKIAHFLGTDHHEQVCTYQDAETAIFELAKIYDEPFADTSAIPTFLISKFVKQQVKVALSGDGGDELFCGYTSYLVNAARFSKINKFPLRKQISQLLDSLPGPYMLFYKLNFDLYNRYLKLKSILPQLHIEEKYHSISRTFTSSEMSKLLLTNTSVALTPSIFEKLTALERMMLVDFTHYLPDNLMVKVDRATMYCSLEAREPLLDHKILEFAAKLPIHLKTKKYILKKILAKYLPISLFERKKHGFGVPINEWLRKELRYLLTTYLSKETLLKQGIFNPQYIESLVRSFLSSNTLDTKIWTLLVFQMWHEKHFAPVI